MSGEKFGIRRAELPDVETLTRIAFSSKGHWGYPDRWLETWRGLLAVTPDMIREKEAYVAVVAGETAGFYVLDVDDGTPELEHLWVAPKNIGTGIGRALFEHALERAGALGAETIEIEADPNAEAFYQRMGARKIGEIHSEIDGQERTLPRLAVRVPAASRK